MLRIGSASDVLTSNGDTLNTWIRLGSGVFTVNNKIQTIGYAYVINLVHSGDISQLAISRSSAKAWVRAKSNDTFTSWKEL